MFGLLSAIRLLPRTFRSPHRLNVAERAASQSISEVARELLIKSLITTDPYLKFNPKMESICELASHLQQHNPHMPAEYLYTIAKRAMFRAEQELARKNK